MSNHKWELKERLADMGIDVHEDCFYTSAMATASFIKMQRPGGSSAYVIGGRGMLDELDKVNVQVTSTKPDYVYNHLGEIDLEAIASKRVRVEN